MLAFSGTPRSGLSGWIATERACSTSAVMDFGRAPRGDPRMPHSNMRLYGHMMAFTQLTHILCWTRGSLGFTEVVPYSRKGDRCCLPALCWRYLGARRLCHVCREGQMRLQARCCGAYHGHHKQSAGAAMLLLRCCLAQGASCTSRARDGLLLTLRL